MIIPDGTLRNDDDPTNAETPLVGNVLLVTGTLLIIELVNGVVFNGDTTGDGIVLRCITGDVDMFLEISSSIVSSIFFTLASIASS